MSTDTAKITLKRDKATGITNNPDIQGVAFNLSFIASKNPNLAVSILKAYKTASKIKPSDPSQPDEDFSLAFDEVKKLIK
jgi:hypothetical protein